jgi:GR25 family glycosyltransferase involved in LPS biosynthesis
VKTYVITCIEDDRHKAARQYFDSCGMPVEYWRAIHGANWHLHTTHIQENGAKLTPGHVGCCLSHWSLWQHIVLSADNPVLILEDDAYFKPGFRERLDQCLGELPRDWDLFYAGHWSPPDIPPNITKVSANVGIGEFPGGTHAYVITKAGASKLLALCATAEKPIDHQLWTVLKHVRHFMALESLVGQHSIDGRWRSVAAPPVLPHAPASMIRFTCQKCGTAMASPPGAAGSRAMCPSCGDLFNVPTQRAEVIGPESKCVQWFRGNLTPEQICENQAIGQMALGDNPFAKLFFLHLVPSHWSRIWEWSWVVLNTPEGASVLDAGGGASPPSPRLAQRGHAVTNIDLEGRGIEQMKKLTDKIVWDQGDIRQLPYPDNSFDCVICCSVLEHVENPLLAVKELIRVASKRLIITMDVATTENKDHTIDERVAKEILRLLDLPWQEPWGATTAPIDGTSLRVLGLIKDKVSLL